MSSPLIDLCKTVGVSRWWQLWPPPYIRRSPHHPRIWHPPNWTRNYGHCRLLFPQILIMWPPPVLQFPPVTLQIMGFPWPHQYNLRTFHGAMDVPPLNFMFALVPFAHISQSPPWILPVGCTVIAARPTGMKFMWFISTVLSLAHKLCGDYLLRQENPSRWTGMIANTWTLRPGHPLMPF